MKKVIARTPRMPSVRAAFRDCGRRNALTPFAIASTPVSAVEPEAKARSSTKSPIVPTPTVIGWGATAGPHGPVRAAGGARDDEREHGGDERVGGNRERQPRLAHAAEVRDRDQGDERERKADADGRSGSGTAETRATTPAATETATVRT